MNSIRLPNQCLISITEKCNFTCRHCFTNSTNQITHEMPLNLFKDILGQLKELEVVWINMTGGEPLLHSQINDILNIALASGKEHIFTLLSNGSLYTDKLIEIIEKDYENHQMKLQFSIDGYDYDSFSDLRKGSTPEQFSSILHLIKKLKSRNHHITVFYTATSNTIKRALQTAKFALENLEVNQFIIDPLFISGRAKTNYDSLYYTPEEWKELLRQVTIIKRDNLWGSLSKRLQLTFFTFFELVVPMVELGMERELKEIWEYEESQFLRYRPTWCEAGITDLCINSTGNVFPCVPAISTDLIAGNIKELPLKDIWYKSELLNWFREVHFDVIKREPCASCRFKNICGGGCRISAETLLGDKYAPDPRCPIVRDYLITEKKVISFEEKN